MAKGTAIGSSLLHATLLATTALVLAGPGDAWARVGVTSATDGDPRGKPPAEPERVLRIGIDVQANEVVTTGANDRAHLVFLDGTSLTVGPNAELKIDKFVYDPATKTGDLAVTAGKGVFRLVGGKISKTNPITVTTPSSTIGIRGGIVILDVQTTRTVSTFVFGNNMTVHGHGHRQGQNVTRQGSQVTTNAGAAPGAPQLVGAGGLSNAMGQLEGRGGGGGGGGAGGAGGAGGGGAGGGGAEGGAQGFGRQNSGAGPGIGGGQPPGGGFGPPRDPTGNRPLPGVNPSAGGGGVGTKTVETTRVTVSQGTVGRFLAQPSYTGFNSSNLSVTRNPDNDKSLAATGNQVTTTTTTTLAIDGRTVSSSVTSSGTITITVPGTGTNTGSLTLPWVLGANGRDIADIATPFGTLTGGKAYISSSGEFFAYVFTSAGNKVAFFGGTPTPTSGIPTTGRAAYDIINATNGTRLPFANSTIGDDTNLQAAKVVSKLYANFTPGISPAVGDTFLNPKATALQATIAISGKGSDTAGQSSYMGVFLGTFHGDVTDNGTTRTDNGPSLSGSFIASSRTGPGEKIGRLVSAEATPSTGNGAASHAIYGTGLNGASNLVLTPDKVQTTYTLSGGTSGTITNIETSTTAQASFSQPYTSLAGTDYYSANIVSKSTMPTGVGTTRNDKTYDGGYVGGLVERRTSGGTFTTRAIGAPDSFSLTTSATNNRVSTEFTVPTWEGLTSATFRLGTTTGQNYSTSAFIDDKVYAMRDRPSDRFTPLGVATTEVGGNTGSDVTSTTVMVSYNTAGLGTTAATNPFIAAGVTPCTCEFMTWGWWGGDISYSNTSTYNAGGRERINLATYVAGTLTTATTLDGLRLANASASFTGHMIGNVNNNGSSYVAAGSYGASWSFGTQTGTATASFDGANFSGGISLNGGGPTFSTPTAIASTGTTGRNLTLNGSFFSGTGGGVVGQGGNFGITGTNYTASGTFAAKKN